MNPNVPVEDRYTIIVSNIIKLPVKCIFSANNFRSAGNLYYDKPHKFGGKQIFVTTDGRERRMFICDGLAYLLLRCPADEDMELFPKVLLTPPGEWKP